MTVPPPSAPAPDDVPPVEPRTESEDADGTEEGTQEARAAQRELFPHAPAFILDRTGFGGSLVGGARHGVSGGGVAGDVFLGGRTENHYYNGAAAGATHVSGEISRGDLDALAAVLVEGPAFASAPARLREERFLVLAGAHAGGRYAPARMLLHRLGVPAVHALSPETSPSALATQLSSPGGHVLRDLPLSRNRPLRDTHLYAARDRLKKVDGYLVMTVENSPFLIGSTPSVWRPPEAAALVRAHVSRRRGADADADADELLSLAPVRDFIAREHHHPADATMFARQLTGYDGSERALARLADFGQAAGRTVVPWVAERPRVHPARQDLPDLARRLRQAPYVLADKVYVHFQRLQHPEQPPEIPVRRRPHPRTPVRPGPRRSAPGPPPPSPRTYRPSTRTLPPRSPDTPPPHSPASAMATATPSRTPSTPALLSRNTKPPPAPSAPDPPPPMTSITVTSAHAFTSRRISVGPTPPRSGGWRPRYRGSS
ncbi:hypothetical protein ACFVWP_30995 [Streptomyces sp. NPDC058175]|uniref:hypothetical protein n=1 Tax=Streptomyces sp. NPDC058175 TaxID=3346367 RepID=UPI0036ED12EE